MKNPYPILVGALALSAISPMVNAEFYIGIEAVDNVLNIKQNDSPRKNYTYTTKVNESDDVEIYSIEDIADIYKSNNVGGKALIGYNLNNSYAIELGYFSSDGKYKTKPYAYNSEDVSGKINIEAISIDIMKRFDISAIEPLSVIASAGIIYQETEVKRTFYQYALCGDWGCPPTEKYTHQTKNFYDTRAQLGLGASYDINEQFTLRSMLKFIPNELSVSSSTPYSISLGALYQF